MQINLFEMRVGAVTICNELVMSIDDILGQGVLSSADARILRGRMVFAEAQVFGRLAGIRVKHTPGMSNLSVILQLMMSCGRAGLLFLRDRVVTGGPPRVLSTVGQTFLSDESGNMLSIAKSRRQTNNQSYSN